MRLMGFDDEDYFKAAKVNSNAQIYKQAGNSIVVNVLEYILRNLRGLLIMKSIIQRTKECYFCKSPYVEDHHIIYGNARRQLSEKYGLKVWLCVAHHRGTYGVHGREGHQLDLTLKQLAQKVFEKTHTRDDFIKIFGKSYL